MTRFDCFLCGDNEYWYEYLTFAKRNKPIEKGTKICCKCNVFLKLLSGMNVHYYCKNHWEKLNDYLGAEIYVKEKLKKMTNWF